MAKIRTKLLVKHMPGCRACGYVRKGTWVAPWFNTGETVSRARDGSNRGHGARFLVLACNTSQGCPAKLIVNENDLMEAAVQADGVAYHTQESKAQKKAKET